MFQKLVIILGSVLVLNACTGSGDGSVSKPSVIDDIDSTIPAKQVDVSRLEIGNFSVSPESINLGQLDGPVKTVSQSVILKNNSNESKSLLVELASSPGFSIKLNRCGSNIAPNATCELAIAFSSRGLYTNDYHTGLAINGTVISVTAQIINLPDPSSTGEAIVSVTFDQNKNFSSSEELPYRDLNISNIGAGNAKDVSLITPTDYVIRINRCPTTLSPNKSCMAQVLYKNYRSGNPTQQRVIVSASTNNNQMILKAIDQIDGTVIDLDSIYTPIFATSFPASTKTATCTGTETVYKNLIDCKDPKNTSVDVLNCSSFSRPEITYKSPQGEFAQSELITGGQLFSSCEEGMTVKVPSRVSCELPMYYAQSNLTCDSDSFSGQYAVVSNPVPNACDGTQIVQRPLVSGTCVGQHNGSVANSYCNASTPQTFESPAGENPTPVSITGGVSYYNCAKGSSLKIVDTRVVCNSSYTAYNLTCQETNAACSISNGTGTKEFNSSTGLYGSCVLSSCNNGYYQSGNTCIVQQCSPNSTASCSITNGTGIKTCDTLGSAYGSCEVATCNSGYASYNGACYLTTATSCVYAKNNQVLNTSGIPATGNFNISTDGGVTTYQVYCNLENNAMSTLDASGGTITYDGKFRIHTFKTGGTFTVNSGSGNVKLMVIGGGGGGGSSAYAQGGGGGGGAGQIRDIPSSPVSLNQSVSVIIGEGGPGGAAGAGAKGTNGFSSSFGAGIVSVGGGGGGRGNNNADNRGLDGGSGGGGGYNGYQVAGIGAGGNAVTAGLGNKGGSTDYTNASNGAGGAGGGGCGSVGKSNTISHTGGLGGDGLTLSITGQDVIYCKGGNGAGNGFNGGDGLPNTGNGGTGAYADQAVGGKGGSGVVIIRYQYKL